MHAEGICGYREKKGTVIPRVMFTPPTGHRILTNPRPSGSGDPILKEVDTDAVLDAFGKNERTQKVIWTFSAAFAGLVLARVVDPGMAETVVEMLAGIMLLRPAGDPAAFHVLPVLFLIKYSDMQSLHAIPLQTCLEA